MLELVWHARQGQKILILLHLEQIGHQIALLFLCLSQLGVLGCIFIWNVYAVFPHADGITHPLESTKAVTAEISRTSTVWRQQVENRHFVFRRDHVSTNERLWD